MNTTRPTPRVNAAHPPVHARQRSAVVAAAYLVLALLSPGAHAQVEVVQVKKGPGPGTGPVLMQPGSAATVRDENDEVVQPGGLAAPLTPPLPTARPSATNARVVAAPPPQRKSAPAPTAGPASPTGSVADRAPNGSERTDRVVFDRKPIRVALGVGRERMISFPGTVALHAPEESEGLLRLQIVGRTMYATALAPFGTMRVIAEDLERDGAQILVDLVADRSTAAASGDVEIAHAASLRAAASSSRAGADATAGGPQAGEAADMVMLTRHAARMVYSPRRLMPSHPTIRQVPIALDPVAGLYRGARVNAAPLGSWRSGSLYVTAVRLTNEERSAIELDLGDVRGHWLAATAQHGRLASAGTDADTTTLYLVCDRPFEACR